MDESPYERPFPALTSEQRYHLDVFGYAVIPNTLTADETGTLREAIHKVKRDHAALNDPKAHVRNTIVLKPNPHHTYMTALVEADPAITAYCTHPRLLGMAEELIGGEARICEVGAIINRRIPETYQERPNYGLHRGTDVPFGSHTKNGLYHCNFVKTLTNLTDLGPDDGGTVVIPGSHKTDVDEKKLIECAYRDPKLVHQVIAPAGSTLLFAETLIHGTGQIRSDNERTIMICGYSARLFPYWDNAPISEEFLQRVPEKLKPLFTGTAHWTRNPKYRNFADPVDAKTYTNHTW